MAPALAALALVAAPGAGRPWGQRLDRAALATVGALGAAAAAYIVGRLARTGTGQAGRLGETMGTLASRLLQAPEILLRYLALLAVRARLATLAPVPAR